jgi:hypothetical protein
MRPDLYETMSAQAAWCRICGACGISEDGVAVVPVRYSLMICQTDDECWLTAIEQDLE